MNDRVLWKASDVAKFLAIDEEAVRKLTRQNIIPAYKVGNRWRYEPSVVLCMSWAKTNKENRYVTGI